MTDHAEEVERLRAERDEWVRHTDHWIGRAESAEAERDDLRAKVAGVEALLAETEADAREHGHLARLSTHQIRAVLATPPTVQREAEVVARDYGEVWAEHGHPRRPCIPPAAVHGDTRCCLTDTAGSGA